MKLEGLFTALVTPFNSYGAIDESGLRTNLKFQLKHNVQGIVILGTTGEAPTLTSKEKTRIIEIAVEEVKGKASLYVGTGSYSTHQTIEATKQAHELGADGALIVTPYYNKPTQEGLYLHFAKVAEAVPLPICVYNIQGRTGQNLQTETLQRLLSIPSIIGVKESSGNILQINDVIDLINRTRPDFKVLSGDDVLTFPLMSLGGHGIISVVSNLIPGPIQKLVQFLMEGDYESARQMHFQLLPAFKAAFIETNPIPIKAAMSYCGMASGTCRLPLCDLVSENFHTLKQVINNIPPSWLGEYGPKKSSCC